MLKYIVAYITHAIRRRSHMWRAERYVSAKDTCRCRMSVSRMRQGRVSRLVSCKCVCVYNTYRLVRKMCTCVPGFDALADLLHPKIEFAVTDRQKKAKRNRYMRGRVPTP